MDILKVIACLMDYPNADVARHKADLAIVISQAKEISPDNRDFLLETLHDIYSGELMDAEECYTGLFEQGRSLSLHVFEHVHGESRDRGQAMVDLMAEYASNGYEIDSRELPDYIPMFLEYLANRPDLEAREWLADVSHILALLGARLTERESTYAHLFVALLQVAGRSEELDSLLSKVREEEPDNTPEALDREWEEVAVTFSADEQECGQNIPAANFGQPVPNQDQDQVVRWVETPDTPAKLSGGQPL